MRNLLIKEIKEEIDHLLNTIYREKILPDTNQIKLIYSDYEPSKAKDLSLIQLRYITGNQVYKYAEEDLYDYLMYTLNSGKAITTKQLLTLLPIFKALINSNNLKLSVGAIRSFMDIHCTSDIMEFKSDEKKGQGIFSILDGLDHILGTKDSFFDINSAAMFIDYYNNKKDCLLVPEYKEKLREFYNRLYSFLEFYTEPEFMSKFNSGLVEDITNINVCKDNENLIKFFLNCDIPRFRNKYYTYNYLNDLVRLASDDKNAIMTRFACGNLSVEDFNNLGRTDITFSDIEDYITSYELAGNKFNSRQLEKLLINYRKNYLNNNYLLATYENEVELVRSAYEEYSSKVFAYTTSDFIEYFNSKYNHEFECFSFDGTSSLLNVDIFEEIINNKSSLIEKLDSVSADEYLDYNCAFIDEEKEKEAKKIVYEKYYDMLVNYLSKKDVTLGYFIRENVSHKDEELFKELLRWYCKDNNCNTRVDVSVKERTASLLLTEALQELGANSLDARDEIIEKYKKYLSDDELEDFCSCTKLGKLFAQAAKERLAVIEDDIVSDVRLAVENDTNFYDIATKYEILPRDIETIINSHFKEKSVREKLKRERHELVMAERDEALAKKKAQTKARWYRIMEELLASNERLEDFCRRYNSENNDEVISANRIIDILRHTDYFDDEYNQYCMDRIIRDKIGHQPIEKKESVMLGIFNGVETCNGRREYTLFDLFMEEGPIRLDDVKYELLDNNPYLGDEYPLKIKAFVRTAIERFGLFFPDNTQERVYNLEEARKAKLIWPVGNTKRLVTEEEKDLVVKFLETAGFPKQMYFDALAAHLRGEYDLQEMINAKQFQKTNNNG